MGVAATGSLHQLIDDMGRGRLIRVAHPEVDNIIPRRTSLLLEITNNTENVRREALNTLKLIVHLLTTSTGLLSKEAQRLIGPQTLLSQPHAVNAAWSWWS